MNITDQAKWDTINELLFPIDKDGKALPPLITREEAEEIMAIPNDLIENEAYRILQEMSKELKDK